jgi:hypothetical protein
MTKDLNTVWFGKLLILSFLLPYHIQFGTFILMPHRFVLLGVVIFFASSLIFRVRHFKFIYIDALVLGSVVWATVSLLVIHGLKVSLQPVGVHFIEFFGAYLTARLAIRSARDFHSVVRFCFLCVLLLFPFAISESITGVPTFLNLIPGSDVIPVDAGDRLGLRRAQTAFSHPILFGVFVSSCFGLFWFTFRQTYVRVFAALVVFLSTFFSLSTGALLSYVVQLILTSWNYFAKNLWYRWRIFWFLLVLFYFIIDILSNRTPWHVIATYASFSTQSAYNRILIWEYGILNVKQSPLFGIGLNDWVRPIWMGSSFDNFWLFLAMRYGIPAFASFSIGLVCAFWTIARKTLHGENDSARYAYLVSSFGIVCAGGTVHYWHAVMAFVLFIFGSGVWMISEAPPEDGIKVSKPVQNGRLGPSYSRRFPVRHRAL